MHEPNERQLKPEDLTPEADLDKLSSELADNLESQYAERVKINERIREGLAPNGKHLRRNSICPCGSGKKFKKCCLRPMKAKLDAKLHPKPAPTPDKELLTDEN